MVSVADLSNEFVSVLREHYSFVFRPTYMMIGSQYRHLDFFEMFAGSCRLSLSVEAVPRLANDIVEALVQSLPAEPLIVCLA